MQEKGYNHFPLKIFCLTVPKNFVRVSKNFMHKKGEDGYYDSPLTNFCVTVPKHFVDKHFCVSEIVSGIEKR